MSPYSTQVPAPALTDTGYQAPSSADILQGVIADLQAATHGRLSFYDDDGNLLVAKPQSQLAVSQTAILSDVHTAFMALMAGIDPQTASGVLQEAIGRIYFMERRAGSATIVNGLCRGYPGTVIPAGTVVQDTNGNSYTAQETGTIGHDNTVTIQFENTVTGPIDCPAGTLTGLYQQIAGWDSITNPQAGIIGNNQENRTDFETRRRNSVAANSRSQNASLMGALLELDGVTDAYVMDNPSGNATAISGVAMEPHALYVLVEGGTENAIGQAILAKKPPGIATMGDRLVTVQDTNPVYAGNSPSYTFRYDRPQPVPVTVAVTLEQSDSVPSDVVTQVQNAIMGVLQSGRYRARMGGTLYASRLSASVDALGDWAEVLSLTLNTDSLTNQTRLRLPINQLPTVTPATITVGLV
ncbi:hypothetical protein GS535_03690 [Saccharibacter sp. EH611]|uniref:baseplate J/gp47 family protein n=2 Tax=Saccharibacter TaxID=231052 RepID=UPI00132909E0|nr:MULTISPECIES: baseplate J/gp47 family protein [unclassified Saccharibacter]MXV35660.1 hypothetical protein [Saccharibacter sp. EH611]MXV66429.1 hypothetical protein [Saccharibacter sp. EH60]